MKSRMTLKPLFAKPVKYVTSTIQSDVDADGNIIYYKPVQIHGKAVVLTIVSRSQKDLAQSRHSAYKLLVP